MSKRKLPEAGEIRKETGIRRKKKGKNRKSRKSRRNCRRKSGGRCREEARQNIAEDPDAAFSVPYQYVSGIDDPGDRCDHDQ